MYFLVSQLFRALFSDLLYSSCLSIRISTTQRSRDCHIVLTDKEMALRASISRYVGAYPIFHTPVRHRPISLFHLEIYLYPFLRAVLAIAFYTRFK